jgi:hypothetical protein
MARRRWVVGAAALVCALAGRAVEAASLSAEYLEGRWTTGGVESCTRPEHEQTVFRKDGTFATEHNGKAVAVGFWELEDDRLDMHIMASEAVLAPALQEELAGRYHSLHVEALLFDVADDRFRMVQNIAGELKGLDVVRCR